METICPAFAGREQVSLHASCEFVRQKIPCSFAVEQVILRFGE